VIWSCCSHDFFCRPILIWRSSFSPHTDLPPSLWHVGLQCQPALLDFLGAVNYLSPLFCFLLSHFAFPLASGAGWARVSAPPVRFLLPRFISLPQIGFLIVALPLWFACSLDPLSLVGFLTSPGTWWFCVVFLDSPLGFVACFVSYSTSFWLMH
jgi:hypothetical protein